MKEDYNDREFRYYIQNVRSELILNVCKLISAEVYVELGTRRFTNINCIAPHVNTVVGVDMNDKWYNKELAHDSVEFYHMSTDDFLDVCRVKYPAIDVLFVDADHTHEQSYVDFCNYKELVKDHGIIFLHDTFPPAKGFLTEGQCGNVWETAVKIKEEHTDECELCTIPGGFGLSVIRMNRGEQLKI